MKLNILLLKQDLVIDSDIFEYDKSNGEAFLIDVLQLDTLIFQGFIFSARFTAIKALRIFSLCCEY